MCFSVYPEMIIKTKTVSHTSVCTPMEALEYPGRSGLGVIAVQPTLFWPEQSTMIKSNNEKFSVVGDIQVLMGQPFFLKTRMLEQWRRR